MLEETLVVWGGEFGRTPMVESSAMLNRSLGRITIPRRSLFGSREAA